MREKFHVINGRFDCSKHMDFLFSHKALTRFEMDTIEKAEGSAAMVSTHITRQEHSMDVAMRVDSC